MRGQPICFAKNRSRSHSELRPRSKDSHSNLPSIRRHDFLQRRPLPQNLPERVRVFSVPLFVRLDFGFDHQSTAASPVAASESRPFAAFLGHNAAALRARASSHGCSARKRRHRRRHHRSDSFSLPRRVKSERRLFLPPARVRSSPSSSFDGGL